MADYRGWNSWLQRGDGVLSDLIGECMTWSAKRSDLRLSLKVKVIKATSGWQRVNYNSWWQRESGEDIKTTSADCSSAMISFYDDMKWSYCWLDNIHRSKAAVIRWCHNSWCCRDLIIMMKWGCDRNAKLKTAIMAKVLKTSSIFLLKWCYDDKTKLIWSIMAKVLKTTSDSSPAQECISSHQASASHNIKREAGIQIQIGNHVLIFRVSYWYWDFSSRSFWRHLTTTSGGKYHRRVRQDREDRQDRQYKQDQ